MFPIALLRLAMSTTYQLTKVLPLKATESISTKT